MTRSSLFPDANDKNQQCLFELEILQATVEDEESGHAKQIGKLIGVDPDLLIDNLSSFLCNSFFILLILPLRTNPMYESDVIIFGM